MNPYAVISELESSLAEWCGSKYCVCVESGTAGIFLSLQYKKYLRSLEKEWIGIIEVPKYTYPSVPCSIIHCGGAVKFVDKEWEGEYQLWPWDIWDASLRLKKGMYHGGMQIISMHIKKLLNLGRGGAILLDDLEAYEWLKRSRFDGRNPVPLKEDNFTQLGFNMYMQPADGARAIELFEIYKRRYPEGIDLKVEDQGYPDLSKFPIYQQ